MRKCFLFCFVCSLFATTHALPVDVYQSKLSSDHVMVLISDQEAQRAAGDTNYAKTLGKTTRDQMVGLVGIPSSITGKTALFSIMGILAKQYERDISNAAKQSGGTSFSLKYKVNIEGLRQLWRASSLGAMLPTGSGADDALSILNKLANGRLEGTGVKTY